MHLARGMPLLHESPDIRQTNIKTSFVIDINKLLL
jgi:hypothetical protein